jgi:ATP-dependent protease ClpP protease subunit
MNSNIKKIIAGLAVVLAVVAYPLVSAGKSKPEDANKIVLNEDNTVSLNGEINAGSVAATVQALYKLDSRSKKPIYLFIYSPGGSIQAGLELIEAAKGMNRPVDTITMFGASMAFQTVQNLGNRNILKNGILMSHRAAGGFEGSFGGQAPSQIDSRYGFWLQRIKELDEQTVSRTKGKQTLQSYLETYKNEAWFTGSQAVEQGYADRIVTVHCDKSLAGTTVHKVDFMGMQIQYEIANCPLITAPLNVKLVEEAKNDPRLVEEVKTKFLESSNLEKSVQ